MTTADDIIKELVAGELEKAHFIIRNALNLMTAAQKVEWARMNDRDGVIGEGTTRTHEREAAIRSLTTAPNNPMAKWPFPQAADQRKGERRQYRGVDYEIAGMNRLRLKNGRRVLEDRRRAAARAHLKPEGVGVPQIPVRKELLEAMRRYFRELPGGGTAASFADRLDDLLAPDALALRLKGR